MAKRVLLIALIALAGCAVAAQGARAKGVGMTAAPEGVTAGANPYRYVALFPNYDALFPKRAEKLTVVEQIDRDGGRVARWWYLRGSYFVPAVAYDGSGGGLSANGRTLVLGRFSSEYPPKTTRLAELDTDLYLNHPRRAEQHRPRHAIKRIDLQGDFSFDAISPDGSTIYLIRYLKPGYPAAYEVRALDTASGRLAPEPIVDPAEPDERMEGLPITRATSPDGRWAYTLYDGNGKEPFVHALDTVAGRAVCVDLPQLGDNRRNLFTLRLRSQQGGRQLAVIGRSPGQGRSRAMLIIDTRTFAVHRPAPVATASSGSALPWLPIGLAAAALAAAIIWILARRERVADRRPLEQR